MVPAAKTTTAAANVGAKVLALDDRMGIEEGTLLEVGVGAAAELVTVTSVPALSGIAPDPGNVTVFPGLSAAAADGTTVSILGTAAPIAGRQATALALPGVAGATEIVVTDGQNYADTEIVRLTIGASVMYHRLTDNATPLTGAGALAADRPLMVTLATALARAHAAGSAVVGRNPLVDVEALDAGIWGNRLRISVEDETPGLVTATTLATFVNPTTVRLASAAGVQPGTVLEFYDANGPVGDPGEGRATSNRQAGSTLTLAGGGLAPAQQVLGIGVRSREFRLTVRLLRQPDPRDAVARQRSDRQRDVPLPLARPAPQQLRREGHRRDRRAAAAVGPPARRFVALHPRQRSRRRPGRGRVGAARARRHSSTSCPTGQRRAGAHAARAGDRLRLDRHADRRPLHRRRQRRPRAAHRACRACATSSRSASSAIPGQCRARRCNRRSSTTAS